MTHSPAAHASLDDWIAGDAIAFSVDSTQSFNAAVDRVVASSGDSVELLGLGEPLHGAEEFLILRNRWFQRLVEAHGYSAIALESSFPRTRAVNEYIAGRGAASYDALHDVGFSHGFGRLRANRELVEWMRRHNADRSEPAQLRFYGFDSPTEMTGADGPRQLLNFALDYLASLDPAAAKEHRSRIEPHLGEDAAWSNPGAAFDAAQSIGLSPQATALRVATEDLVAELQVRRPEPAIDEDRHAEAARHASLARQLLAYHAEMARASAARLAKLLGLRDLMMADNLTYAVSRERGRERGRERSRGGGRVLAFAHNMHLQRGMARWQLGPHPCAWWPAGAHLSATLGTRYGNIGTGVGIMDAHGIAPPEPGTLEARLTSRAGPAHVIATRGGRVIDTRDLPTRSGTSTNGTYFPLSGQSLADFDFLAVINRNR